MSKSLQIRIWARKKAIDDRQGDYALNVTGPILQFYERYYNATYPLSKSGRPTQQTFSYEDRNINVISLMPHSPTHSVFATEVKNIAECASIASCTSTAQPCGIAQKPGPHIMQPK